MQRREARRAQGARNRRFQEDAILARRGPPPARGRRRRQKLSSRVTLAGNLDLVGNSTESRQQILDLIREVHRCGSGDVRGSIFFDLAGIRSICPLSILYLLAWLETAQRSLGTRMSGTYPLNEEVSQLFSDLGFWRYIRVQSNRPRREFKHAAIRTGETAEGWTEIRNFLVTNAKPPFSLEERDQIYFAVGELVENVLQHAFPEHPPRWYAVGVKHPSGPAVAAIVDLGVGIPSSVKRRRFPLGAIENAMRTDSEWLGEATTGRTRTGEEHRGNGLSKLRAFASQGASRELAILSGTGLLSVSGAEVRRVDYAEPLIGTLIAFTLHPAPRRPSGVEDDT